MCVHIIESLYIPENTENQLYFNKLCISRKKLKRERVRKETSDGIDGIREWAEKKYQKWILVSEFRNQKYWNTENTSEILKYTWNIYLKYWKSIIPEILKINYTWNTENQLYFNKICISRKKKREKGSEERQVMEVMACKEWTEKKHQKWILVSNVEDLVNGDSIT